METLDIALIHPELIYPRGAEKQLCNLAHQLSKDHEVAIYTFEKSENYIFNNLLKNCDVVSLNTEWQINNKLNYFRWCFLAQKLSTKMRRHDVINTHNFPASWVPSFRSEKSVWMCNEPPHVYNNPKSIKKFLYRPLRLIDKALTKEISKIACLDKRMHGIIKNYYPNHEVVVTGSAAELSMRISHIENNTIDILLVAALYPQKRPLDLIRACAELKNIKLHIVGDGPLFEECKNIAKILNVNLVLYGNVSEEKLYELYSIADIAVYPSENQPWGIFPLESILAGIPTITSDQTGVNEILGNNIVFKTGNISDLSHKINETIENIDVYRLHSCKDQEIIKEQYNWRSYSRKILDLLKKS